MALAREPILDQQAQDAPTCRAVFPSASLAVRTEPVGADKMRLTMHFGPIAVQAILSHDEAAFLFEPRGQAA